jgi:hypothetical protein
VAEYAKFIAHKSDKLGSVSQLSEARQASADVPSPGMAGDGRSALKCADRLTEING